MGSGCYVVVCCSINIVRVFIVVDTVTESDVTIVSASCSVLKSRSIKNNSRCRAFNKNQLSLSSVPPPPTNVSPRPLNKHVFPPPSPVNNSLPPPPPPPLNNRVHNLLRNP
ncbi:unnamed protein product [Boreogadus saida]